MPHLLDWLARNRYALMGLFFLVMVALQVRTLAELDAIKRAAAGAEISAEQAQATAEDAKKAAETTCDKIIGYGDRC
ncbi:MAG: hypothetical protein V4522_08205 [Pseudomonadota bacterium]|jgi:hypothetical protein